MESVTPLLSSRIVVGLATQRLADLATEISTLRAQHIVVLHETTQIFVGLVKFADVVARADASNRILADLVSKPPPITVPLTESAAGLAATFERYQLGEVIVMDRDAYVGIVTAQSVLEWLLIEYRRAREDLQHAVATKKRFVAAISHELRTPLTPALLLSTAQAANQELPEAIRQDFRDIAQSITQETKLISDLIDLAALTPPEANPSTSGEQSRFGQRE